LLSAHSRSLRRPTLLGIAIAQAKGVPMSVWEMVVADQSGEIKVRTLFCFRLCFFTFLCLFGCVVLFSLSEGDVARERGMLSSISATVNPCPPSPPSSL
jgi:hypothetical protein